MPDGDNGRPPLAQPRGEEAPTIRKIFENAKIVKKLQSTVPRHLNPERMLRVLSLAVQKTPKLADCDPVTLLGAMMVCASLGLEPNTPLGHAYLIPFEKRRKRGNQWVTESVEVNLILGYKGYIDLARRSGSLVSLHADVVYGPSQNLKGDEFSFEYGSNMHLRHVPIGDSEGRPPIWAYAHASLKDGQAFEVLPYERVLSIRDASQGYQAAVRARNGDRGQDATAWKTAPWVAFEHEMASKTMIRRLSKMLPLSIEFANAAALDAMSETGDVDLGAFADGVDMASVDVTEARRNEDEPRQIEQSKEQPMNTATIQQEQREPQPAASRAAEDDDLPPHMRDVPPIGEAEPVDAGSQRMQAAPQQSRTAPQQQGTSVRQVKFDV
jgi:recombination protein RecT